MLHHIGKIIPHPSSYLKNERMRVSEVGIPVFCVWLVFFRSEKYVRMITTEFDVLINVWHR
jgi:hypothetical protein